MRKLYCHKSNGAVYEVANEDNYSPNANLAQKIDVLRQSAQFLGYYFEHLYKCENGQVIGAEVMFDNEKLVFEIN